MLREAAGRQRRGEEPLGREGRHPQVAPHSVHQPYWSIPCSPTVYLLSYLQTFAHAFLCPESPPPKFCLLTAVHFVKDSASAYVPPWLYPLHASEMGHITDVRPARAAVWGYLFLVLECQSSVTLSTTLHLSGLSFPLCKMGSTFFSGQV